MTRRGGSPSVLDAPADLRRRADALDADRVPYVVATVVRAERPTSAKAGDTALVLTDGSILGFVGGECAEASVQAQALVVLRTGEALLLRIDPETPDAEDADATPPRSGAISVHNPCLSGGTLEIFLDPVLPEPLIVLHGDAPIAHAVADLAEHVGYAVAVARDLAEGGLSDADAVVVASHGREEADVLRGALAAGVPYIGLVASPRRGAAVLDALDLADDERARITTPAGFDIGARTPEEVALSILAEIVSRRPRERSRTHDGTNAGSAPDTPSPEVSAIDPVCGMTVAAIDTTRHHDHEGRRHWFCGSGCAAAFAADPATFITS